MCIKLSSRGHQRVRYFMLLGCEFKHCAGCMQNPAVKSSTCVVIDGVWLHNYSRLGSDIMLILCNLQQMPGLCSGTPDLLFEELLGIQGCPGFSKNQKFLSLTFEAIIEVHCYPTSSKKLWMLSLRYEAVLESTATQISARSFASLTCDSKNP